MQDTKLPTIFNRLKRKVLSRVWLSRLLLILALGLVILAVYFISRPLLGPASVFIRPLSTYLDHTSGRTNIVFLGVGGPGHEAPDLTDTIIFASVHLDSGKITLLTIPRDLWVPTMQSKINTAYHYGELRRPGSGGITLAKASVSEVLGVPVHYAVVLNFSTFVQFIDHFGGLDVQVPVSFTDPRYPIPGRENDLCGGDPETLCRYETISFSQGLQHMNGDTALKFVRSRHADNDEGTDYARSRRQTEVIRALRSKLLSLATDPRNFDLLRDGLRLATSSIQTDFPESEFSILLRLGLLTRDQELQTAALTEPETLYHPPVSQEYGQQWVLVPADNNPKAVFDFVANLLK